MADPNPTGITRWIVEKDSDFGYWTARGPKPGSMAWEGSFGFASWREAFNHAHERASERLRYSVMRGYHG